MVTCADTHHTCWQSQGTGVQLQDKSPEPLFIDRADPDGARGARSAILVTLEISSRQLCAS